MAPGIWSIPTCFLERSGPLDSQSSARPCFVFGRTRSACGLPRNGRDLPGLLPRLCRSFSLAALIVLLVEPLGALRSCGYEDRWQTPLPKTCMMNLLGSRRRRPADPQLHHAPKYVFDDRLGRSLVRESAFVSSLPLSESLPFCRRACLCPTSVPLSRRLPAMIPPSTVSRKLRSSVQPVARTTLPQSVLREVSCRLKNLSVTSGSIDGSTCGACRLTPCSFAVRQAFRPCSRMKRPGPVWPC